MSELVVSRELDALVAEKVMGLVVCSVFVEHGRFSEGLNDAGEMVCATCDKISPKYYSTSIAAAWEVVEKFTAGDWFFLLTGPFTQNLRGWRAEFQKKSCYPGAVLADTAPLAICRAALMAVEKK